MLGSGTEPSDGAVGKGAATETAGAPAPPCRGDAGCEAGAVAGEEERPAASAQIKRPTTMSGTFERRRRNRYRGSCASMTASRTSSGISPSSEEELRSSASCRFAAPLCAMSFLFRV